MPEALVDGSSELEEMFRQTPLPLALIDLGTNRLTSVNARFAALLGLEAAQLEDLDLLSLVSSEDRGVVERILVGMASGLIDSCQGRGRLHPSDGQPVDVVASVRPLGAVAPRARALVIAAPGDGASPAEPWQTAPDGDRVAFGVVDHHWRFREMSADAAELFAWDTTTSPGTPLQAIVHPDDASTLLLTLGRSATERRVAATRLRVSAIGGGWTHVRLVVSPLCQHHPPKFAVALWFGAVGDDPEPASDRIARLESHLWRIAVEVQSAGISDLPRSGEDWWTDPALLGLSRRQTEILRSLVRGQRVPAIASRLFLSQSTVRNHLSAIYRKIGVHSQSELLVRLMPPSEASTD